MLKNYIAEGAVVKGKVQMGEDVSIWYNATVRGDSAEIKIGDRTNVQDNAVIHALFFLLSFYPLRPFRQDNMPERNS